MNGVWTKKERDDIGRPITRWEVCPWCGKTPAAHFYNPTNEEMTCPGKEPVFLTEADLEKLRAFDRQMRLEARRQAGWRDRKKTIAAVPKVPQQQRKYFDDET